MEDCIFCKIANGKIKTEVLFEDDNMVIVKDINPIAPIHLLLIVKEHYARLNEQSAVQADKLGECLNKVGLIKNTLGLENGFRVIINQGKDGGQTVQHLHAHLLGGKQFGWDKL